ncbi:MAG: hypothetical protein RQ756_00450 [Flavobacteriaceae bacterium]|nr:hypothetical protein [Flavobacteriaceae bacterium]
MNLKLFCALLISGTAMAQIALDQKREVKSSPFVPIETNVKFESKINKDKSFDRITAETDNKINIQDVSLEGYIIKTYELPKLQVEGSSRRSKINHGNDGNDSSDNSTPNEGSRFSFFRLSNYNACVAPVNFREQYRQSTRARNASK